jgi:hypothetical protein
MTRLPQQQRRSSRSISAEVPMRKSEPATRVPLSEAPPPPASSSFQRQRILHFPLILGCSFSSYGFVEREGYERRPLGSVVPSLQGRGPALNDCSQSFGRRSI